MTPRMELQADQVRTVMTAGDRLDDITRARMWSAIEDHVSAPALAARPARVMRTAAIALGAVAVAAAAILVVRARGTDDTDQLTVAADATLTHRLGSHARAALVGPARLELLGPAGPATSVRLHAGTLLADFDGGPGRSLRIEAGDLVAEVVGTLFAIEVTGERACVAVAHGTVRVTSRGTVELVTDHQQLCSGDTTPHAIPDATADQLARHERALAIAIGRPESPPSPATPTIDVAPVAPAPRAAAPSVEATAPTTVTSTPSSRNDSPRPPVARAPQTEPERATTAAAPTPRPSITATPRSSAATSTVAKPRPDAASSPSATPRASVTATTASAPEGSISSPPPTPRPSVTATTPPPANAPVSEPTSASPRSSVTASAPSSQPEPMPVAPNGPASTAAPSLPPSAEELYRAAEVALAAGDRAAAVRALTRILALPGGALADQALYELARIEYQRRAWTAARKHLAALAAIAGTPLAEPGRYLDCRIAVEAKANDAERCFTGYRTAYPRSPHDLDVLAVLVQLAHARAGCDGARVLRDELLGRYPRTDHAAAWRSRCSEAP